MRVERDPVWPLPRHHDDESLRRDSAQLGDRDPEVLHVLERVRGDDGVECIVSEGQAFDVRLTEDRALMADGAVTGCECDVDTDDAVLTSQDARQVSLATARTSSTVEPTTEATTPSSDSVVRSVSPCSNRVWRLR